MFLCLVGHGPDRKVLGLVPVRVAPDAPGSDHGGGGDRRLGQVPPVRATVSDLLGHVDPDHDHQRMLAQVI